MRPLVSVDLADHEGMGPQLVHQAVFRSHAARTLSGVLARPIRIVAITASIFVVLGWSLFAIDQIRGASTASVAGIAGDPTTFPDPSPRQEAAREKVHGKVREFIDDVNDILLAPFAGLVDSSNSEWVRAHDPRAARAARVRVRRGFLARFAAGRP